jgi:meiotically up-regulated gene 157 (Mug157) protein
MKNIKIAISILLILICYYSCKRPNQSDRKYSSEKVDAEIETLRNKFLDPVLFSIYENCYPNTLDTTVEYDSEKQDTFVITGDIPAMWLRDSAFQLIPYLKHANDDEKLNKMLQYAIKRQVDSILIDPYANAFNKDELTSPFFSDNTFKKVNGTQVNGMTKKIWERKYELNSPLSALFFHYKYFKFTNNTEFINTKYLEMLNTVIKLIKEQSLGTDDEDENSVGWTYFFQRNYQEPFDSLHMGRGNPVKTCGLVRSSFRGSDDSTLLPFNIAENAFLVSTFKKVTELLEFFTQLKNISEDLIKEIQVIKNEINEIIVKVNNAIIENGILNKNSEGKITENSYFAYEVDCFGNSYFMDDSNYPSLMGLKFINYVEENSEMYSVWNNTKKRILSKQYNPYYFESTTTSKVKVHKEKENKILKFLESENKEELKLNNFKFTGVGSSHTSRHNIWPLGIIMRGLTSSDKEEIAYCIEMLKQSALETGFMHESFNVNNPNDYTRSWFAWANSFFGFFINDVIERYPDLVLKS